MWINGDEKEISTTTKHYSLDSLFVDGYTPYIVSTISIPRLKIGLSDMVTAEEEVIECYTDVSKPNASIYGQNIKANDIYVYDSSIHIVGSVNNKGRYWLNGNERELAFKPFGLYVNGDNVWMVGIEDRDIIVYKNDERTVLVRDAGTTNVTSKIYPDGSDLIIILKYYDSQTRKNIFKIFKNRREIDIYDFRSSGLYASKVLYRNGIIYSYGVTEGGNYYYSIGNKSYNLLEKGREMIIHDFDVKHNNVYMVGAYNGFPFLWKNKEKQLLSDKKITPTFIVVR
jgi:hypothetical protein